LDFKDCRLQELSSYTEMRTRCLDSDVGVSNLHRK